MIEILFYIILGLACLLFVLNWLHLSGRLVEDYDGDDF